MNESDQHTESLLDPDLLHLSIDGKSACDGKPLAQHVRSRKGGVPICYVCALIDWVKTE